MPTITYGKDKKELKASNPKALEYLLKQRLKEMNERPVVEVSDTDVKSKIQVVIDAPGLKKFFSK